jgi:nitronate monooxygenase
MRKSMVAQGLDPADFGLGRAEFCMAALSGGTPPGVQRTPGGQQASGPRRYRDIWSAGHSVSGVHDVSTVADVVGRLMIFKCGGYGWART